MRNAGNGNGQKRWQTRFVTVVFVCYILLLLNMLFFSRITLLELFNSQRVIVRSINLIPFHSIMEFTFGSSSKVFALGNVAGNVVLFLPLGFYLLFFKEHKRAETSLLTVFLVSLCVEVIQGLLGIGVSDVDDIILNCLGGWIGIAGYQFLTFLLRDERKLRATITVLSIIGLLVILFLLFIMRMRF